ncbi:hypothetical protein [Brevibacillus laterosporus]|uniref:hypothetical protein n=1 Tax=Brevibacillus laterosporus TaxID=1465 RepID=UPI000E6D2009|nr:hypothetical protein [Brevibacillus laterosporus]AYB38187.1 hypothetical protein D5F52_07785 [Brevibacillus laterosporus]MBM7111807.1 hypothetical protein [Brevibacillus laterosporus]
MKKAISSLLLASVVLGALVPSAVFASTPQQYIVVESKSKQAHKVQPQGWKSDVSKHVVKNAAAVIRNGGKLLEEAIYYLSKDAAKAFGKHSKKMADFIDGIAKKMDEVEKIASTYIRNQLRIYLENNTSLSHGVIEEIVDAVEWLLWFMV